MLKRWIRKLHNFIVLLLAAALLMPMAVHAEDPRVEIREQKHAGRKGNTILHDAVIIDVDAPKAGRSLDAAAKVITAEGVVWEIPVFWLSSAGETAQAAEEGTVYMPVLAFYVPEGYEIRGLNGAGEESAAQGVEGEDGRSFRVGLSQYLTQLFEAAGGAVTLYHHKTGITFIFAPGMDPDLSGMDLDVTGMNAYEPGSGRKAEKKIPGLPEELSKPSDGTYNNPRTNDGNDEESGNGEDSESSQSGGNGEDSESSQSGGNGEEGSLLCEEDGSGGGTSGKKKPGKDNSDDDAGDGSGKSSGERSGKDSGKSSGEGTGKGSGRSSGNGSGGKSGDGRNGEKGGDAPSGNGSGNDHSGESSGADEQESAGPGEKDYLYYCGKRAVDRLGEDELKPFVDLIINCIVPQASELIKTKFPSFEQAARDGELGEEIGLYVYYMIGDRDGTASHSGWASDALAAVKYNGWSGSDAGSHFGYLIGVNAYQFATRDNDGKLRIDQSEQAAADLDNTMVHELFHAFMVDYNRTGMTGFADPAFISDYSKQNAQGKSLNELHDQTAFPMWFQEGLASCVENIYQYRYESFQLLRYEGEGQIGSRHTMQNLLNTYMTTDFVLDDGITLSRNYDLEDPEGSTESRYLTGYLAMLYLGEMSARASGTGSSVSADDAGLTTVSSERIRLGVDCILNRLHRGENLDEVIRSISGGRYTDTSDFERRFIKGLQGTGDRDSLDFCVSFLNYMLDIGANSAKIPNGSILYAFDMDYTTPIDRMKRAGSDVYKIANSNDYVESTAGNGLPQTDGGKSMGGNTNPQPDPLINNRNGGTGTSSGAAAARNGEQRDAEAEELEEPEGSGEPEELESPEKPEEPEGSGEPEETEKPEEPDGPGESEEPDGPGESEEPQSHEDPGVSAEPEAAEQSGESKESEESRETENGGTKKDEEPQERDGDPEET